MSALLIGLVVAPLVISVLFGLGIFIIDEWARDKEETLNVLKGFSAFCLLPTIIPCLPLILLTFIIYIGMEKLIPPKENKDE